MDRLGMEHIEAFVSPLHDRDTNPDGTQKKPHYHVMLMFDGKKSMAQIDEIRERCLGPNYNKATEDIGSPRGYARYLLHLDNPEKARYNREDVRELSGADYDAMISLPGDDVKAIGDIMQYIREHDIRYYSDFMLLCRDKQPDWFRMLVSRKSYTVVEFIKSEAVRREREERAAVVMRRRVRVDPETGEILESEV